MSITNHSLGGHYPYKMDTKCRVSIPSDWRAEIANNVLRLLVAHEEKIPTLKVLTECEFEKMLLEIESSEKHTPPEKRVIRGVLFERSTKAQINEQGKLTIPKAQLDHPAITPGDGLVLCGRGNYFVIFNEENYEKLKVARETTVKKLNDDFDFL